ncbi:MAG: hypothetical protein ACE5L7_12440, partial [Candidatus Aminicenantales bacterium]
GPVTGSPLRGQAPFSMNDTDKVPASGNHSEWSLIPWPLRALRGAPRATHPLNKIVTVEKKMLPA